MTKSRKNRTWLCSVLFMDIVGYSKYSVDQQMLVKQSFCSLVSDALMSFADDDCIKLDTGDGLAICYLSAPEDVLYVAVGLRDAFQNIKQVFQTDYTVRMGINLGPVKILEDINGQRNTIGDGINAAQRIMSFAKPNQLLVSRTYYDVISCLSDENPKMFAYIGVHNDKHVRQFDVYEVLSKNSANHIDDDSHGEANTEVVQQNNDVLSEEQIQHVQSQLALIIGPMARVLVKRAVRNSSSLDQLYQLLLEEIPTEQEKQRFLASKPKRIDIS